MKRNNLIKLIAGGLFLLTISCSHKKTYVKGEVDTSFLDDKNFVYHNIRSTLNIKRIGKRGKDGYTDNKIYTDSAYRTAYVELTSEQRAKLIAPFLSRLLGTNTKYVVQFMQAEFISKQAKIGDLQPIIISVGGDDYDSDTMIILNKQGKPIGGVNISGGLASGPSDGPDSTMSYEARSYAYLDGNKITTVRINYTESVSELHKKPTLVDSVVFESVIGKNGKIRTKQTLKKQYIIPASK